MFTNYSQTFASQIAVFAGMIVLSLRALGIEVVDTDVQFAIGIVLNFGGILWNLYHRYNKGDVTAVGSRKK